MVTRAVAILSALLGSDFDMTLALRVARAFAYDEVEDVGLLTNAELASHFIRGVRRLIKLKVLQVEERQAAEAARLAARADASASIDLGDD